MAAVNEYVMSTNALIVRTRVCLFLVSKGVMVIWLPLRLLDLIKSKSLDLN